METFIKYNKERFPFQTLKLGAMKMVVKTNISKTFLLFFVKARECYVLKVFVRFMVFDIRFVGSLKKLPSLFIIVLLSVCIYY